VWWHHQAQCSSTTPHGAAQSRRGAAAAQAAARVGALRRGLCALFAQMPRDLQQAILSVPARAALLHGAGGAPAAPGSAQVQRGGGAAV